MAVSKRLRDSLRWGDDERDDLADAFLEHKIVAYIDTLVDLARQHGADVTDDDIDLPDSILLALKREAVAHAGSVVDTYNSDVEKFLDRNAELPRDRLLATYDAWAADRADARAELIAVTEAYSAHADATLAFYRANAEGDLEFDFGGHPGDDPPVCGVCQELEATNPHPYDRVLAVGNPHPNCRQSWRPRRATLGDELRVPDGPAGIVGGDPLVIRAGGEQQAVDELRSGDA